MWNLLTWLMPPIAEVVAMLTESVSTSSHMLCDLPLVFSAACISNIKKREKKKRRSLNIYLLSYVCIKQILRKMILRFLMTLCPIIWHYLLCLLDFAEPRVLQVEWQVDNVPKVVMPTDGRFIEYPMNMELYSLVRGKRSPLLPQFIGDLLHDVLKGNDLTTHIHCK